MQSNPREFMGANNPPPDPKPSAIELAKPVFEQTLGPFLKDNPVITNETESREAKAILDRATAALKTVEAERTETLAPIREKVEEINSTYHKVHNTDAKRPGLWDTLVKELKIRMTKYATAEESRRQQALAAARKVLEDAERIAREKDAAAREAAASAAQGICGEDFAGAVEQADTAFNAYERAGRFAARAEKETKVRIVGGSGNAVSLRNVETLTVTDWKAAIEAICINDDPDEPLRLPKELADMICRLARTYRSAFGELPPGIAASFDRKL